MRGLRAPRVADAVIAILLAFIIGWNIRSAGFFDFAVYFRAGKEALAGQTVYAEVGHFQYKYSPLIALFFGWVHAPFRWLAGALNLSFRPLAEMHPGVLTTRDFIFTGGAFYIFWAAAWIGWAYRWIRQKSLDSARLAWISLVVLVIVFNAFRFELELGQANAAVVWLMGWTVIGVCGESSRLSWRDGQRDAKSRLLLIAAFSFALQFKLYAFILAPLLVFRRRWDVLVGGVVFTIVSILFGVGAWSGFGFAWTELTAWLVSLTHSSEGLLFFSHNISLLGTVGKITGVPILAFAIWALAGLIFLGAQWRLRERDALTQISLAGFGILILNPLVWNYWILLLIPALASLVRVAFERRSLPLVGTLLFTWLVFNAQHAAVARDYGQPLAILTLAGFWWRNRDFVHGDYPRSSPMI